VAGGDGGDPAIALDRHQERRPLAVRGLSMVIEKSTPRSPDRRGRIHRGEAHLALDVHGAGGVAQLLHPETTAGRTARAIDDEVGLDRVRDRTVEDLGAVTRPSPPSSVSTATPCSMRTLGSASTRSRTTCSMNGRLAEMTLRSMGSWPGSRRPGTSGPC
jgi:hypothetical protein